MKPLRLYVTLNGTMVNPWHRWNLRMNPFPQVATAELVSAMMQLNSLDGDPMRTADEIADRLPGWSPEFVELCKQQFRPGERVKFQVVCHALDENGHVRVDV